MPKKDGTPTKWELRDLFFEEWSAELDRRLIEEYGPEPVAHIRATHKIQYPMAWGYPDIYLDVCKDYARIFIERGLPNPPTWWKVWAGVAEQAARDGLKVPTPAYRPPRKVTA